MRSEVDSGEPVLHWSGPPTGRQVIKDEEGTSNEQYNFEQRWFIRQHTTSRTDTDEAELATAVNGARW